MLHKYNTMYAVQQPSSPPSSSPTPDLHTIVKSCATIYRHRCPQPAISAGNFISGVWGTLARNRYAQPRSWHVPASSSSSPPSSLCQQYNKRYRRRPAAGGGPWNRTALNYHRRSLRASERAGAHNTQVCSVRNSKCWDVRAVRRSGFDDVAPVAVWALSSVSCRPSSVRGALFRFNLIDFVTVDLVQIGSLGRLESQSVDVRACAYQLLSVTRFTNRVSSCYRLLLITLRVLLSQQC